ncbi:uncharacterized protein UV8b_07737 [Ustilaginoidea virens]|uniref:Fatty acid desaturase domain-containing protein n=1 Tax=Ustilaginoidea virens TaxID=1159556 RepID=A0A8E5ML33_USTVR|nr:uncharacterized protein UV8b_07737 [Ustilaginoidea virens]QUC23496.1 hypothetical protein UV8b_07737 [Ustilaginoidea virens]
MPTTTVRPRTRTAPQAGSEKTPDLQLLRRAVPKHCFQASNTTSALYALRDLAAVCVLSLLLSLVPHVASAPARWALWTLGSFLQGLFFTGIWIVAHECGHEALFTARWLNDAVGFVLHSLLLVPFFSWKYTHARHHRYTNHMEKDTAFVPHQSRQALWRSRLGALLGLAEDSPVQNTLLLLGHQLLGWPMYMLAYVSAGPQSGFRPRRLPLRSHFNPKSGFFTPKEQPFVLLSDLGIGLVAAALWLAARRVGCATVLAAYVVPYLWVNHWIVAITFLHHTHHSVHHYKSETWTYTDGALSTVDRDFGFVGKHIFHGIIEFHVVHHLFPRIPFYHAEEATESLKSVLGDRYVSDPSPFLQSLWKTFATCTFVAEKTAPGVMEWVQ